MRYFYRAQLIVLTLFVYNIANSQTFTASFESGYSFNHNAVAGFTAGINFKYFSIRAGVNVSPIDQAKDGILLKTMLAHTFDIGKKFYGTAGIGYAYIYKSTDDKSLNKNEPLLNPELGYKMNWKEKPVSLYFSYINAGNCNMLLCGLRGYF